MDLFNLRVKKFEGDFVYPKDDKSQAPKGRIKFIWVIVYILVIMIYLSYHNISQQTPHI